VMPAMDASRVVFLDETGAKTDMAHTHGYAPRGQRLEGSVPCRRWQTSTFVGAMRAEGFVAPLVVDGAMTGELFEAYIQRVLLPELRTGDVVVLDNLSCHRRGAGGGGERGKGGPVVLLPGVRPARNPSRRAFCRSKSPHPQ